MYKWEEGLKTLGLELVEKVGEKQVVVRMEGFDFLVYKSGLTKLTRPTIMTCLDKTGYFLHIYKGRLIESLDYSKFVYLGYETPATVTCHKHGDIQMRPDSLVQGHGCNKCGEDVVGMTNRTTPEQKVQKFREVHGDRYEYGSVGITSRELVSVKCSVHGWFDQTIYNHQMGKGCPQCALDENPAFNKSSFAKYPKYYLYIFRMWCDETEEDFIKIGISKDPHHRCKTINNTSRNPYSSEVLFTYEADGETCWSLERFFHREFKEERYKPKENFAGSTECFTPIDIATIQKLIACCA